MKRQAVFVTSRVVPEIKLHFHPGAVGSPDLLTLHTHWQYSAKVRQFSIPRLVQCESSFDSLSHIDATADVAEELSRLAKKGAPVSRIHRYSPS